MTENPSLKYIPEERINLVKKGALEGNDSQTMIKEDILKRGDGYYIAGALG